jgi:negative regulator of sigma-B (phosphoserine phosphatase)
MGDARDRRFVDWSVAERPSPGEVESGDRALVVVGNGAALVAAIDGLGRGREAARAAEPAVEVLRSFVDEPLPSLLGRCHDALRGSRGAAMSVARLNASDDMLAWIGVGNVEGRLVRTDGAGAVSVASLMAARGIAGDRLPDLHEATLPIHRGDVVLLATDGIDSTFADSLRPYGSAEELTARILSDHSKSTDDALVVAVRYLGRSR